MRFLDRYPQCANSSAGKASKNSGPTSSFPFIDPGKRFPFTSPMATSRATGFERRAMMTCSPCAAFWSRRERLVSAS